MCVRRVSRIAPLKTACALSVSLHLASSQTALGPRRGSRVASGPGRGARAASGPRQGAEWPVVLGGGQDSGLSSSVISYQPPPWLPRGTQTMCWGLWLRRADGGSRRGGKVAAAEGTGQSSSKRVSSSRGGEDRIRAGMGPLPAAAMLGSRHCGHPQAVRLASPSQESWVTRDKGSRPRSPGGWAPDGPGPASSRGPGRQTRLTRFLFSFLRFIKQPLSQSYL